MEIIKEINLNVNQPNNFELINVMQGSLESVKVIAHLYDGNKPYTIPESVTEYQILGTLPSGKYLIDDKVTKYNDNSVTFFINQNMMAKAGYVEFTISLVEQGDEVIVETFPAKIMVTSIPGQDNEQTDEIPIITKALQETKRNADRAEDAANRFESLDAITKIKNDDDWIECSQVGSTAIIFHKDVKRENKSSELNVSTGDKLTVVKSVKSDEKGHITEVETENVHFDINSSDIKQEVLDKKVDKSGDTMHGELIIQPNEKGGLVIDNSSNDLEAQVHVKTSKRHMSFYANTENIGLWDYEYSKPILSSNKDGNVTFNGTANNADTLDNKHASTFLGNTTGYICPFKSNVDINTIVTEWHGFVFNASNNPTHYGFLDVTLYDGASFSPSPSGIGVVRQIWTDWETGKLYTRTRRGEKTAEWSPWITYLSSNGTASNSSKLGGYSLGVRYNCIPFVSSDGAMEFGRFLDFHYGANSIEDYDVRVGANGANELMIWGGDLRLDNGLNFKLYNGIILTSDKNEKEEVSYVGKDSLYDDTRFTDQQVVELIDGIETAVFKMKDGTSGRPHHGLISNDFEELLKEIGLKDHAGFIKSPIMEDVEEEIENENGEVEKVIKQVETGKYRYGFRYEELITDIIRYCQIKAKEADIIKEKISDLEEDNEYLKNRMDDLEEKVSQLENIIQKNID